MIEINRFDSDTTDVRAIHIIKVTFKLLVTANAEQIPKICRVIGFSLIKGLRSTSLYCLRLIIKIFQKL